MNKRQLYELYNEYETEERESITDVAEGYNYGTGPRIVTHTADTFQGVNSKPYLILDVRETADYLNCHLLQARNFPYTLMRRDQSHPEFHSFKNKPETLIIIYCDDEKISRDAAKLYVDRGTDNIFLLTGGLAEFAAEYPGFIEGELPPQLLSPTKRGGVTGSKTCS